MDPFARKMILAGLAFGAVMLLMAGAVSVVYFHNRPRCSEQVLSEANSPDRRWTAAVMERRCGEESPFFIHVNLRPVAELVRLGYFSGRAEDGDVFVVEEGTEDMELSLEWSAPGQLTIRCPRCRAAPVEKREERLGTIVIKYEMQP